MQYQLGTVQVTNGSPNIVFTGAVTGASAIAVGHLFKTERDGDSVYQLSSRTPSSGPSITSATLSSPYGGLDGTGLFYQIVSDFTLNRGYPRPAQGDADAADWIAKALDKIDADIAALLGTGLAGAFNLNDGGVIFKTSSGITTDRDDLYWDNATKKLGIGLLSSQPGAPPLSHQLTIRTGISTDGIRLVGATTGRPRYELYDGSITALFESYNGVPCLSTDALTFTFYDSNTPRMRLDAGRLVIGNGSAGNANPGEVVLGNAKGLRGLNASGSTARSLIMLSGLDEVLLAADGQLIRIGTPAIALGGVAVATLGSIGGAGPTNTAQKYWLRVGLSTGEVGMLPVWIGT